MADTPIWVQLVTPVLTAAAAWFFSKSDVWSLGSLSEYKGNWYAYYRDPDTKQIQEEIWTFSRTGNVTVGRNGKTTFRGRLSLKNNKAYMHVKSTVAKGERLFVMLNSPTNPRTGDSGPSVCVWLGQDGDHKTTAGHGMLSRTALREPNIKNEFIRELAENSPANTA